MKGFIIGGLALILGCNCKEPERQAAKSPPGLEAKTTEDEAVKNFNSLMQEAEHKEPAVCQLYRDEDPRALELVNKGIQDKPTSQAYAYRARLYLIRKDYAQSVNDSTKSIELGDNPAARLTRSKAYLSISKEPDSIEKALKDMEKCITLTNRKADKEKLSAEYENLKKEYAPKKD